MKQFQIFEDPNFGQIRTTVIDGNPHFVGRDVAVALGYTKTNKAIRKHVAIDDLTKVCVIEVAVGPGISIEDANATELLLINEKGVHALISGSAHPQAKSFKEWLMSKIIPSVQETKTDRLKSELHECVKVLSVAQRLLKSHQKFVQEMKEHIKELKCELGDTADEGEDEVREDSEKSYSTADIASELGMDPKLLNLILCTMGILKREDGELTLADKYRGRGYTKDSSN